MGRIFIAAGHSGSDRHNGFLSYESDSDYGADIVTEVTEMIALRDLLVSELRSRDRAGDFEVLSVPDELSIRQITDWIKVRARPGDVALALHADAHPNSDIKGAAAYYITHNSERRSHAELLLLALLRRVPRLSSRGARPDIEARLGHLPFCRGVSIPSLHLRVACLSHPSDLNLLRDRRRDIALGLADGLSSWSRLCAPSSAPDVASGYPMFTINLNGGIYPEPGIMVNGNPCIPTDLCDRLGVDLSQPHVGRIRYRQIVYTKALDLREHNISVGWNNDSRTLNVQSAPSIYRGGVEHIMGQGSTSEVQLIMFLKANNEKAIEQFSDLPKYYREEAAIEGVNHDIAFSQMCLETHFLSFGGALQPGHNNFAGLGVLGDPTSEQEPDGAQFRSRRLGVRAHIQHLKAYASQEPLVQELADPRFCFVSRGVAPKLRQLAGRWSANPDYGLEMLAILRRLYELSGLA